MPWRRDRSDRKLRSVDGDEDVPDNEYEAITCQACSRIHLVNRKTGKVLGQQEDR